MKAAQQDGSYPRSLMCREAWTSLDGTWQFAHDDCDVGVAARWFDPSSGAFRPTHRGSVSARVAGVRGRSPEFHPVVWHRRTISHDVLAGDNRDLGRILVHFGAVDHSAQVWFDGQLVASHVGGQTPFTAALPRRSPVARTRFSMFSWSGPRTTPR